MAPLSVYRAEVLIIVILLLFEFGESGDFDLRADTNTEQGCIQHCKKYHDIKDDCYDTGSCKYLYKCESEPCKDCLGSCSCSNNKWTFCPGIPGQPIPPGGRPLPPPSSTTPASEIADKTVWIIVGSVLGVVVLVGLIIGCVLCYFCWKKRTAPPAAPYVPSYASRPGQLTMNAYAPPPQTVILM